MLRESASLAGLWEAIVAACKHCRVSHVLLPDLDTRKTLERCQHAPHHASPRTHRYCDLHSLLYHTQQSAPYWVDGVCSSHTCPSASMSSVLVAVKLGSKVPTPSDHLSCFVSVHCRENARTMPRCGTCIDVPLSVQESVARLQYVVRNLADSRQDLIHVLCVILQQESREEERRQACHTHNQRTAGCTALAGLNMS